jgi:pyruvate ferredoxin oxidoreductase gamma subunit
MYRIRFHGRGGQGMKTASRILGTACFLAGWEVQDAPRYGAERRGAPIFAFVRADRAPIRERGIIGHPDLVVVADATLVPIPAAGVLAGLDAHALLLVNSTEPPDIWKGRLNLAGPVVTFDAAGDARERSELPFVGAACAGAAAGLLGFLSVEHLEQAIREELGGLGDPVVRKNLDLAMRAHTTLRETGVRVAKRQRTQADAYRLPDWVDLACEEARIAAPVIHAALTSEAVPTGLWRTLRPVIDYDHCNRCWWVCSAFCPDGAIRVEDGTPHIDYEHCKGCLVCLAQCPPHAISAVPETKTREAAT